MAKVLDVPSHSLREFRILPGFTPPDGNALNVDLSTRLCRRGDGYLKLHSPFLTAAMQAVTGVDMAIAIAQLGGIGILPVSQTIEDQADKIGRVKRFKAGFQTSLTTLSPRHTIAHIIQIMDEMGYSTFPVTDTGEFNGKLLGVITDKDFDVRRDHACTVQERMRTDVNHGVNLQDLKAANQLMIKFGRGFLPIVDDDGMLVSAVFKKDLDKHLQHPNESIDLKKRLLVGAAVSTHPEDRERVQCLVEQEADVLVIDASDGHTHYQRQMIEWIKSNYEIPVIGGNVVTARAFEFLVEAGVDAVKVGMGIGSGCTTQEVKATGRGQGSTLLDIGPARDRHADSTGVYIPITADGGISGPADMSVALALGADALMMGNFFARYTESAGNLMRNAAGEIVKEYWMEGSAKASNHRRYSQLKDLFFEEGITGYVPHLGSIFDKLPVVLQILRSTMATAGCRSIEELHTQAVLEKQSPTALRDSDIHDMVAANIDQQIL
ncbi:MAG: CBS domain-containing protein [Gemmatimonadetes bacterium]|nr:CBS domain-containing protein [Gemmatimonadota bacterium]MBT6145469.1 CBS domain-containing protein [Gemmatimonadota bacterium]MBT7861973.1 CBS domain-containing protein [Gemmatimonadota bacterium]